MQKFVMTFVCIHVLKDDRLKWTTPPSRQLSRQKRVEYESDIRERFYDDYLGDRTGDAFMHNDVIGFQPGLFYRWRCSQ